MKTIMNDHDFDKYGRCVNCGYFQGSPEANGQPCKTENERLRDEIARLARIIEAKEQAARELSCDCDKEAGFTCVRCQCLYAGMDIP